MLYLDADTLVHQPFPEIWLCESKTAQTLRELSQTHLSLIDPTPFAACRDIRQGHGWLPNVNGGVLLLKPNRALLAHMLSIAPKFRYNANTAEQGLLDGPSLISHPIPFPHPLTNPPFTQKAYFAQTATILPYTYNAQLGIKRIFPETWSALWPDVKVIHYTGWKPWQLDAPCETPEEKKLWWDVWREMESESESEGRKKGSVRDIVRGPPKVGRDRHPSDA